MELGPRYEYLRELGSGGAARVFLARDLYLKRELALKLLREAPVTAEELEQVQREFALLSEIQHPGIARAFDFGYLGGRPFFTSEFIPGEAVDRRRGGWPAAEVLRLAVDLSEALAFLHARSVAHLDVKPANVIACRSPGRRRAVLIDFGLFRRGVEVPASSWIRGSLPYMAPEHFRGEALGPRTDVYALGVTLYRVATGRFPRRGGTAAARHGGSGAGDAAAWDPAPPAPAEIGGASFPDLDRVILRCLALDPRSRFPSAHEAHEVLARLDGGPLARPRQGIASLAPIGRSRELARAEAFLDSLASERASPRVFLVTGPPGAGLSHFLRAVKVRAQTRGLPFYLEVGYPGRPRPPGSLLRALGTHLEEGGEARARWETFLEGLRTPRESLRSDLTEGERGQRRAGQVILAASEIAEPLVLAVDGLQHWDEVSVELFAHLARWLAEREPAGRPPLALVAAYREEGPPASLLRDLTGFLLEPGKAEVLALGPLGIRESRELYRSLGGSDGEATRGLSLLAATGGYPGRIAALALGCGAASPQSAVRRRPDPGGEGAPPDRRGEADPAAGLGELDRRALVFLELAERPVTAAELARLAEVRRDRVERAVARLAREGWVASAEEREEGREAGWIATASARPRPAERRAVHSRLAEECEREAERGEEARLVEAVRHWGAIGRRRRVVSLGRRAAAWLKSRFQHRAALEMFRAVLEACSARHEKLRLEVAIEVADLHSRIGDAGIDEGIRILRELLPLARKSSGGAQERVLLWLATLHSRRGDFRRAEALFGEGLRRVEGEGAVARACGRRGPSRDELLFFTNEHAIVKTATGRYDQAREICREGLRLAGRARSARVREVVLNLHATRANIALRTLRFDDAIEELQRAIEIAEVLGSPANHSTLLNNLGAVYSQCDRYREAIRAYLEAEKACRRLDEGPSLAAVYANRAVLLAKTGEFAAMEETLEAGERLVPAVIGRRQEFFLRHARGLCRLAEGRYGEARRHLEAAIETGEAIGDRHVVAFDRVYRAEALVFEGKYAEASGELERLSQAGPARVRRMAQARRAYLLALLGRVEGAELALDPPGADCAEAAPAVPYLDAGDALFRGWAVSILGRHREALELLAPAARFFRSKGLAPASALAGWVLAERAFLCGDLPRAREALARIEANEEAPEAGREASGQGGDLLRVLGPLLEGRLELETGSPARGGDALVRAGTPLVGRRLPEWSLRLEALQARLRGATPRELAALEERRRTLVDGLGEEDRSRYLRSEHWSRWTRLPEGSRAGSGRRAARAGAARSSGAGEGGEEEGAIGAGEAGAADPAPTAFLSRARRSLVARSSGMRRLLAALDRLRGADLPVLIQGETGAGKDLVARVVHEESPRAAEPLRIVDCATIPPGLLESELFGARAGSFTGLEEDRPGLLVEAGKGTVLIDEIGGVSLEAQAKLLRLLSARRVRPVGAEEEVELEARFLFSTSRDLEAAAREGSFREDLLHRVRVITLRVPPLRDRPEDLEDLVALFLAEGGGAAAPEIEREAIETLRRLPWPGNARELRNVLARARLESPKVITAAAIERGRLDPRTGTLFPQNLLAAGRLPRLQERLERDYIVYHYRRLGCDTAALLEFLALSRRSLYRRCAKLGIRLRGFRKGRGG